MGNVPAKEGRSRSSSYAGPNSIYSEGLTRSGRRNTTSSILFNATHFPDHHKKSKSHEEKEKQREKHHLDLIVRYNDNVDGGYLAPFGTYKSNLDYNTTIVRDLIINRKLAPFYTPLQDFSESWTDDELTIIVSQLPLHSIDIAYSEEEEVDDIDDHKIHRSTNFYKRQEQKLKLQVLIERMKELQKHEEEKYLEEKIRCRDLDHVVDSDLPLRQLLLRLYKSAVECPICFLYYPNIMNYSRCCRQPICTECFVQIKRLDPHPPHDDASNDPSNNDTLPHTLISESANCPYCAMSDFGVTYEPPRGINTGVNGIKPSNWHPVNYFGSIPEDSAISSSPEKSDMSPFPPAGSLSKGRRRSSVAADAPGVITTDYIRPDWEQKLASSRNKLARKAATASAIHASNLLISSDDNSSKNSSNTNGDRIRRFSNDSVIRSSRYSQLQSVEQKMIEQALRLSILDEEERKRKAEPERKK